MEGKTSHNLERNVISGGKNIKICPENCCSGEREVVEFREHEVYAMDIVVTTGTGQAQEKDLKATVFRKTGVTFMLKMKTSRELLSQVSKSQSVMPFHLNYLEDPKKARTGVVECANHEVLQSYPVLCEKEGSLVAQFKFTVLMMPNGPLKITGHISHTDILFISSLLMLTMTIKLLFICLCWVTGLWTLDIF